MASKPEMLQSGTISLLGEIFSEARDGCYALIRSKVTYQCAICLI